MTLNQLIYFQTIARLEHFRKAAEELNISQPSLSHSMSSLEDELGLKLFKRNGRNITLTKYGKVFLEKIDKILFELDLAQKHMKQLSGTHGHIDIAYVYPLSYSYIPKLVREFLSIEDNKNTTFSFHQQITVDIIKGLMSEKFDVGFCAFADNSDEIEFVPLIKQEMVVITSKSHELSKQDKVKLKDIEKYQVIGYDRSSGLGKLTKNIFLDNGLHPEIVHECPDENSIASLVAEDFGIALVANIDSLENHSINILKIDDYNIDHTVYFAYKKDNYQLKAIKKFIEFTTKHGKLYWGKLCRA